MAPVLESPTRDHSEGPPAAGANGLRIVMADDDQADQRLLWLAVEEAGIDASITFVDDGVRLLSYLHAKPDLSELPDLILLDLKMPGVDGHRVLDELQADPVLWQIPVLVLTSSELIRDQCKAYSRGAKWYEIKPRSFGELVELVETIPARARRSDYEMPDGYGSCFTGQLDRLAGYQQMIDTLELDADAS